MKNTDILATANKEWGFWGTAERNGYDAELTWNAASKFFITTFDLNAEQARDVLDARFGRHLADDLSFIKGTLTEKTITAHLKLRIADAGWRENFESAITEVTGKTLTRKTQMTKDERCTLIAQRHLNIETLETRKSDGLDFHDVAVWCIKDERETYFGTGWKTSK